MMYGYILKVPMNQRLLNKLSKEYNKWSMKYKLLKSNRKKMIAIYIDILYLLFQTKNFIYLYLPLLKRLLITPLSISHWSLIDLGRYTYNVWLYTNTLRFLNQFVWGSSENLSNFGPPVLVLSYICVWVYKYYIYYI